MNIPEPQPRDAGAFERIRDRVVRHTAVTPVHDGPGLSVGCGVMVEAHAPKVVRADHQLLVEVRGAVNQLFVSRPIGGGHLDLGRLWLLHALDRPP